MFTLFRRQFLRVNRLIKPLTARRLISSLASPLAAIMLIVSTAVSGGRSAQAQTFRTPQAILLAYYSAIGLRNYPQAYSYWTATPVQSYADFASGFLTTDHVMPYFGQWQIAPASAPPGETGRIPALLVGAHTDGTIETYSGCFMIGSPASGTFGIAGAAFTLIGPALPDATAVAQALKVDCYVPTTPAPLFNAKFNTFDAGQQMLAAYYKRVNQHDYANAYALWLHPTPGPKPNGAPAQDNRPAYADFVAGYSDTVYVFGYYGQYVESGASAGRPYLDGVLPVVLIGYHADGSVSAASGCYVLGNLPNGGVGTKSLGIVAGVLKTIPPDSTGSNVPDGRTISTALAVDCTALSMQF